MGISVTAGTRLVKRRQEFTTTGAWTCPAGVTRVSVFGVSGGGSGRSIAASNIGTYGGGGGGQVRALVQATPGQMYPIIIGQGGDAVTNSDGNAGGATTAFGLSASGGSGGTATSGAPGNQYGGAAGGVYDVVSQPGTEGFSGGGGGVLDAQLAHIAGGTGGGGRGGLTNGNGGPAPGVAGFPNTGGGGGGAITGRPSGAGGSGFVRLEWEEFA